MTITERDTYYELQFPYNKRIIEGIKSTFDYKKRSYNPETKTWTVNKTETIALKAFAEQHHFIWQKEEKGEIIDYSKIPPMPELEVNALDYMNIEPFPYQKQGIAYILKHKRILCGDSMGLGKSAQAIGGTVIADAFPNLVVAPASLKYNWQDEWMKFANTKSIVLNNSVRATWPNFYKIMRIPVFITNYESLLKFFVAKMPREDERFDIRKIEFTENVKLFKSIIVDESHKCKNEETRQSRIVRALAKFMEYRLFLTGTPIVNAPKDLIPILDALGRMKELGGRTQFMKKYCSKETTAADLEEMNYKLRTTCFFMREKKEVLKDLPEKTRQKIHCDLSNRAEYDKAEKDFENYLRENVGASDEEVGNAMRGEIMVKIGHLKRLAAKGKLKDTIEYIRNVNESGEKIIIFCWHKDIAREIQKGFPQFKIIDGDVDPQVRHSYVNDFQNNPHTEGIISTISTGGVGYNMTASSIVLFIEMGWSPKDQDQAEDRSLRIGQKNAVTCPYMIGRETIDEHIYNIIEEKRKIVKAAFGLKHDIKTDIVQDIINIYKKHE